MRECRRSRGPGRGGAAVSLEARSRPLHARLYWARTGNPGRADSGRVGAEREDGKRRARRPPRGGVFAAPSSRGPSWPPSPRRLRRGAHVPGRIAKKRAIHGKLVAPGARGGVFADPERFDGQLSEGGAFLVHSASNGRAARAACVRRSRLPSHLVFRTGAVVASRFEVSCLRALPPRAGASGERLARRVGHRAQVLVPGIPTSAPRSSPGRRMAQCPKWHSTTRR